MPKIVRATNKLIKQNIILDKNKFLSLDAFKKTLKNTLLSNITVVYKR